MQGVSKISSEQDVMLISFTGVNINTFPLSSALSDFAASGVVVDMICQSAPRKEEIDYSFTTSYSYFSTVLKTIAKYKAPVPLISSGYTKINLYGEDMVTTCGVAAMALKALSEVQISIFMITTSDLDISLLIREEDEDTAITSLEKAFSL
ncbi:MAG: ACT domain-containing protein [Oscillospiraceae bacterium]